MQTTYATHLTLPSAELESTWDTAVSVLEEWLGQRFEVSLASAQAGAAEGEAGSVAWTTLEGASGALLSVAADRVDVDDPGWRWRTFLDLGRSSSEAWLRVRVGLVSELDGVLTRPRVVPRRPGVVPAFADAFDITLDGWRLGEWRPVRLEHVGSYLAFLRHPGRRLPVVTLSETAPGETFLDPAELADQLLGLAHVVVVDTPAAYRVTDEVGKTLSCFLGAVRVYWPGFSDADDPYHHRLFVAGSLRFLGADGVGRELFDMLGRLAGLGLDEPALRRRLKIERRTAEVEARSAERLETLAELASVPLTSEGGVDAETWESFAAEFDAAQAQIEELELAGLDAEAELETLRRERDDARAQLLEVVRSIGTGAAAAPERALEEPPASVGEAVARAQERSLHCVFLAEAFASAGASQYDDPPRVLADLLLVEEIARDWAAGELAAGPHEAFKQRCSGYRDGIGQKASTQYRQDYERDYEGEQVMLGPHISRGIGAVSAILRIYFYFDTARQRIVVGHVGRKLRDDSNRN